MSVTGGTDQQSVVCPGEGVPFRPMERTKAPIHVAYGCTLKAPLGEGNQAGKTTEREIASPATSGRGQSADPESRPSAAGVRGSGE